MRPSLYTNIAFFAAALLLAPVSAAFAQTSTPGAAATGTASNAVTASNQDDDFHYGWLGLLGLLGLAGLLGGKDKVRDLKPATGNSRL